VHVSVFDRAGAGAAGEPHPLGACGGVRGAVGAFQVGSRGLRLAEDHGAIRSMLMCRQRSDVKGWA
jgi:hypothetical protein